MKQQNLWIFPDLEEFRKIVDGMVKEIPPKYLRAIGGISIDPSVKIRENESEDDIYIKDNLYILGHYIVNPPLAPFIKIYYGSFQRVFNGVGRETIECELWNTLCHEVKHHLENQAGVDYLGQEDLEKITKIKREEFFKSQDFWKKEPMKRKEVLNFKQVGTNYVGDIILTKEELRWGIKMALDKFGKEKIKISVKILPNTNDGKIIRLSNIGYENDSETGDLYLKLHIKNKKYHRLKTDDGKYLYIFKEEDGINETKRFFGKKSALEKIPFNEKKINFDYYYDLLIYKDELLKNKEIKVVGVGKNKNTVMLRLKSTNTPLLRLKGLGDSDREKKGDIYLSLYYIK